MPLKKGGASSGGIQLSFDDNGEPHITPPNETTEECLGGVKCRYCEIIKDQTETEIICVSMICAAPSGNNQSVFSFKECPEGKWVPIENLGEAPVLKSPLFECDWDACCNCGTSSMWKLKAVDNWVCARCHPPPSEFSKKKIEYRERAAIIKEKGK